MKKYLILAFCVIANDVCSQNTSPVDFERSTNPGHVINEIKLPLAKTTGSIYLIEDWQLGNFTIKGVPAYKGFFLRFDLKDQNLEIKVDNKVKVCVLSRLENFSLENKDLDSSSYFVNINTIPNHYAINTKGVVQVLYEEKIVLYKYFYLETKKATYVPTVALGNRNEQIIKKSSYYVQSSGKVYKISASLKKNKELFINQYIKVENFIKENKLKLKSESDLIKIVKYYNLLLEN